MASESADPIERWTAKRRMTLLVVSLLKGEAFVAEAARKHGLTVPEVEDWREKLQKRVHLRAQKKTPPRCLPKISPQAVRQEAFIHYIFC